MTPYPLNPNPTTLPQNLHLQVTPILVGVVAYGLELLYEMQSWLVSLPVGGFVLLLLFLGLTGCVAHRIARLCRRKAKPTGAMLTPIPTAPKKMYVPLQCRGKDQGLGLGFR